MLTNGYNAKLPCSSPMTLPTFSEKKLQGLERRKPDQVVFILGIEMLWETYAWNRTAENMDRLLNSLRFVISRKADAWARKWKNKRLQRDDFESIFYETAWDLCDSYNHYQEFYLYETLCLAIHRRGIDLTRRLLTKQTGFEMSALPLHDRAADYLPDKTVDIENTILTMDLIGRILHDESLTVLERQILQTIYDNPDASYRKIAELTGVNQHKTVTRSLRKIHRKINYFLL